MVWGAGEPPNAAVKRLPFEAIVATFARSAKQSGECRFRFDGPMSASMESEVLARYVALAPGRGSGQAGRCRL